MKYALDRRQLVNVLSIALALPTAGFGTVPQAPAPARPSVATSELSIPTPDLSALQPAARSKIRTVQQALESLISKNAGDNEIREGFGLLGQMFHAFELLEAAETCYRNARAVSPDDPRWPYFLALVRNARGDLEPAAAAYREAIAITPDLLAGHLRLGNVLLELGRNDEAEAAFEKARDLEPESPAALYGLGRTALSAGRHGEAIDLFTRALIDQPQGSVVHYSLAQAYRRVGDLEAAEKQLALRGEVEVRFPDRLVDTLGLISKSVALEVVADLAKPTDGFDEESFLGFVLSEFGQSPGAADQLQKMVEHLESSGEGTPPQIARVHYAIGGLLVGSGRDEEALDHFRKALAGDPELQGAELSLANTLARTGRFEEAVSVYGEALKARPDDPEILLKRATALTNQGKLPEARRDAERLIELDPRQAEARTLLSEILTRSGEPEAAADNYLAAIRSESDPVASLPFQAALGDLYQRQGELEKAAQQYSQALAVDEQFVPALRGAAGLLAQVGQFGKAVALYRRWISIQPENPTPRVGEATSLILGGAHVEARSQLDESTNAFPDNLDLMDLLARHLAACPDRSVRDGKRAVELAGDLYSEVPSFESVETLAMAHAEARDFAKAVDWQQQLIEQAGPSATPEDLQRWRANLALYQRDQSCCAPSN
jgi:tetratricopeptide (TPR) repeat protein